MQVHGHDRAGELADAMKVGAAVVVERHERITGYATALAFFRHAVAETNLDLPVSFSCRVFGPSIVSLPSLVSRRWCQAIA